MQITAKLLVDSGLADQATADKVAPWLNAACQKFEITEPVQIAQFLAQCSHESGKFKHTEEGLFYSSPERLMAVWPSRFPTLESAQPYAKNPKALASKVYADRMGNGDEASGAGYLFRGRGFIQTTGKSNYQALATALNMPLIMDNPDLLKEPALASLSAAYFWHSNNLNAHAHDCKACTKIINGGQIGLAERQDHFESALNVLLA